VLHALTDLVFLSLCFFKTPCQLFCLKAQAARSCPLQQESRPAVSVIARLPSDPDTGISAPDARKARKPASGHASHPAGRTAQTDSSRSPSMAKPFLCEAQGAR